MKGSTDALLLSRHCPAQLMAIISCMAKDGLGKSRPCLQHVLYPEIPRNKTNSATPLPIQFAFQLKNVVIYNKDPSQRNFLQLSA